MGNVFAKRCIKHGPHTTRWCTVCASERTVGSAVSANPADLGIALTPPTPFVLGKVVVTPIGSGSAAPTRLRFTREEVERATHLPTAFRGIDFGFDKPSGISCQTCNRDVSYAERHQTAGRKWVGCRACWMKRPIEAGDHVEWWADGECRQGRAVQQFVHAEQWMVTDLYTNVPSRVDGRLLRRAGAAKIDELRALADGGRPVEQPRPFAVGDRVSLRGKAGVVTFVYDSGVMEVTGDYGRVLPVFPSDMPFVERAESASFKVGDRVTFLNVDKLCRGVVARVFGDRATVACARGNGPACMMGAAVNWDVQFSPGHRFAHDPSGGRDLKHEEPARLPDIRVGQSVEVNNEHGHWLGRFVGRNGSTYCVRPTGSGRNQYVPASTVRAIP